MAEKWEPWLKCKARQFVDFEATEMSFIDDYFDGRVSLWSKDNIEVSEKIAQLSAKDDEYQGEGQKVETPPNIVIGNIKKDYRVPSTISSLSPCINPGTPSYDSPELEYTRPWLNKTCSSLISAMNALEIHSTSSRTSLTPYNKRNFNLSMETSTPFITVKEKSKTRCVETKKHDLNPKTPECREIQSNAIITRLELQEAENPEIFTQVGFREDVQLKASKFSENNSEKDKEDAKAAGDFSDQIVPIIALNSPNNEANTQMDMVLGKSESDYSKEFAENVSRDSAKNTENLDGNLSEPAADADLDEHLDDAAAELLKFHSHVDATEIKEESGGRTKTRKTGVLVNKARRQSHKFRRQSGKFVSMAEAILKFQKGTPKRFYSTKRMMNSGPSQAIVQSSRKVTLATSPVLLCKSRCRRTLASNQQEKESTEKNAAKYHGTSKKITQTAPLSFDTRKKEVRDKRKTITTKNPVDTIPATATTSTKVQNLPEKPEKILKTKSEAMPSKSRSLIVKTKSLSGLATKMAKSSSDSIPKTTKKTGGPTSKTDAERIAPGATMKLETKAKTKSTCALSFEERNKLLLKKREESMKRMIEQEKQKRIFHARPAPTFKPVTVHGSSTENLKIQHKHQNVKTSKKENSSCGLKNQENKSPSKTVHSSSTENLKIQHKHQNVKTSKKENSSCDLKNQENRSPLKTVHSLSTENLKIQPTHLNVKTPATRNLSCDLENQENRSPFKTEDRCRKRRLFDAEIKKKEEEAEARRKEEEIERLETMKSQEKELRKTMELKAKPIPTYKHPQIAKSRKPLTDPQSPAWSRRTKK